jgi:hypothetical protein
LPAGPHRGVQSFVDAAGTGYPRIDRIHPHAPAGVGIGIAHGGQHQGGVRRTAADVLRIGLATALPDHVDDASRATRRHRANHRIDRVHVAEVLRLHRREHGGRVQFVRRRAPGGARAIDQHVDGPVVVDDALHHPLRRHTVLEIRRIDIHGQAQRRQLLLRDTQVGRVAGNADHAGAFAGEGDRASQSDALARAGDDDDATSQFKIHMHLRIDAGY